MATRNAFDWTTWDLWNLQTFLHTRCPHQKSSIQLNPITCYLPIVEWAVKQNKSNKTWFRINILMTFCACCPSGCAWSFLAVCSEFNFNKRNSNKIFFYSIISAVLRNTGNHSNWENVWSRKSKIFQAPRASSIFLDHVRDARDFSELISNGCRIDRLIHAEPTPANRFAIDTSSLEICDVSVWSIGRSFSIWITQANRLSLNDFWISQHEPRSLKSGYYRQ